MHTTNETTEITNLPTNATVLRNVPFDEYCAIDAEHFSRINHLITCPADYESYGRDQERTESMKMGTILHTACLEPERFLKEFAELPDLTEGIRTKDGEPAKNPRGTTEYKLRVAEWTTANPGREGLEGYKWHVAVTARDTLRRILKTLELTATDHELTITFDWLGLAWKSRIDLVATDRDGQTVLVDLKFPGGDAIDWQWRWHKMGYHRQAALYFLAARAAGYDVQDYYWFVIEQDTGSWNHALYAPVTGRTLEIGMHELMRAVERLRDCQAFGFHGYEQPHSWSLSDSYREFGQCATD